MASDTITRFLFERLGVRGEIVRLEHSYQTALERHPYPAQLGQLLGQAMAAACLLGATVKDSSKLILQIQGKGPATLLVAEYDSRRRIRGLVQWQQGLLLEANINRLFGEGYIAITIDQLDKANRYQGIVELVQPTLASCLEHYFSQSEQLPTRLWLVADTDRVAGLMLQQLPSTTLDYDDWQRLGLLADTLTVDELLGLETNTLLRRLFHEDDVRVFDSDDIRFHCSCSRERIENMLRSLGQEEVRDIVAEQGGITVDCEYCRKTYQFDRVDAEQLFTDGGIRFHSATRH